MSHFKAASPLVPLVTQAVCGSSTLRRQRPRSTSSVTTSGYPAARSYLIKMFSDIGTFSTKGQWWQWKIPQTGQCFDHFPKLGLHQISGVLWPCHWQASILIQLWVVYLKDRIIRLGGNVAHMSTCGRMAVIYRHVPRQELSWLPRGDFHCTYHVVKAEF